MNRSHSQLPAWQALQAHAIQLAPCHLRQLFADDPQRGQRFSAEACGWYLNYAKNRITVTNAAASSRYLYAPYETMPTSPTLDAAAIGDAAQYAPGLRGQRSYTVLAANNIIVQ